MAHIFICSLVEEELGCLQFLAAMNKDAMNVVEQVSSGKEICPNPVSHRDLMSKIQKELKKYQQIIKSKSGLWI